MIQSNYLLCVVVLFLSNSKSLLFVTVYGLGVASFPVQCFVQDLHR